MTLFTFNVTRLLILSALAAVIAFLLAPCLIRFLNKNKFWKKEARKKTITGEKAEIFYSLHKDREVTVPRGGGALIWLTVLIVIFLCLALSFIENPWWLKNFNFFSRAETWLPLFTLVAAALVGLLDDVLQISGKGKYIGGGMKFTRRLLIVILG